MLGCRFWEVRMAFHISGKLCALGVVVAALITAFSVPKQDGISLEVAPVVELRSEPVEAVVPAAPVGPIANPRFVLRATGYNSLESQTDSTPHITATGARTRFGIIAVSRDMLGEDIPYGSLVRIRDLGSYYSGRGAGRFQELLDGQDLFIVEDTMHQRKRRQVDVWFGEHAHAVDWGVRRVEVEVVRYGRYGPVLPPSLGSDFEATVRFPASTPAPRVVADSTPTP